MRRGRRSAGRPDGDDLLGIHQRLSLGLGALGLGRSQRGCALPFLRSAVRSHGATVRATTNRAQLIGNRCRNRCR
jgi:hypothetical protein